MIRRRHPPLALQVPAVVVEQHRGHRRRRLLLRDLSRPGSRLHQQPLLFVSIEPKVRPMSLATMPSYSEARFLIYSSDHRNSSLLHLPEHVITNSVFWV